MINIFTLRDFKYQGGGMIRILGILKSINYEKHQVRLFSNQADTRAVISDKVSGPEICDFFLDFTSKDKKFFQFALSFLPISVVNIFFKSKLNQLKLFSKENQLSNQTIFCCEYLDLSLGYFMKMNGLISDYICDIHGLVPNEFSSKKDHRVYNFLRYSAAVLLDRKVFSSAKSVVYASSSMKEYMVNKIPKLINKKSQIIPYLISRDNINIPVCYRKLGQLKSKYKIKDNDVVFFFAGSFKTLGGIIDLLNAFNNVTKVRERVKLIIIGQGEEEDNVIGFIDEKNLNEKVIKIDSVQYSELRTFQELSHIIICPDRMNLYSDMILHLKYIDSLVSGKIVINGNFKAVSEINLNQSLSINFKPSDILGLYSSLIFCLDNKAELVLKYSGNPDYVRSKLTYESLDTNISELF